MNFSAQAGRYLIRNASALSRPMLKGSQRSMTVGCNAPKTCDSRPAWTDYMIQEPFSQGSLQRCSRSVPQRGEESHDQPRSAASQAAGLLLHGDDELRPAAAEQRANRSAGAASESHLKTEQDSTNNKTLSRARALLLCVDAHSWWAMHHQPAGAMTAGGWAYTGCW